MDIRKKSKERIVKAVSTILETRIWLSYFEEFQFFAEWKSYLIWKVNIESMPNTLEENALR